eukprot:4060660-Pleurochrysis_carterae.AAC.1
MACACSGSPRTLLAFARSPRTACTSAARPRRRPRGRHLRPTCGWLQPAFCVAAAESATAQHSAIQLIRCTSAVLHPRPPDWPVRASHFCNSRIKPQKY